MIKCLSKDVQAKLRSGVAIFSLQQCVEELILNSIDAGATCVAVKLDIEACKVQVIDNGSGMGKEDMERVGIRYNTSKCSKLEDLDNLHFYGFRGEAISSIVSLATHVEITSRTKLSVKTHVKTFNEGRVSVVTEAQITRPTSGTTVSLCNFFHNMPVRRKRMDSVLEVERIRQRVEAISLMHPPISFTVRKDCSCNMLVQLSKARNTYYRFVQIHGLVKAQKLGEINYSHGQFEVSGHIGRDGHYNSNLQFLFVNSRLLLRTRIHKLLNCLLRKVSSVSEHTHSPNTNPATQSPKSRSGSEQHGVYIINIKCHYSEYDICLEPAKTLIEFKDWDNILICIQEGVKAFLTKEKLVSEYSMKDIQECACPNVLVNQTNSPERRDNSMWYGTTECNDAVTLASRAVYRGVPDEVKRNSGWVQKFCMTQNGFDKTAGNGNVTYGDEGSRVELAYEDVSSDTEFRLSSESDTEILVQQNDPVSQVATSASTPPKHIMEKVKYSYSYSKDSELSHNVNNNEVAVSENSRFTRLMGKDEGTKFIPPNQALKRKLSLLDCQNLKIDFPSTCVPAKVSKVIPHRKLSLSFATSSLDRFRRLYGKTVETELPSAITNITDMSQTATECPNALKQLRGSGLNICKKNDREANSKVNRDLLGDSPITLSFFTERRSTSSHSESSKVSLAAKLFKLKQERIQDKRLVSEEDYLGAFKETNISNGETLFNAATQDSITIGRSTCAPAFSHELLSRRCGSPQTGLSQEDHLELHNSGRSEEPYETLATDSTPNTVMPCSNSGDHHHSFQSVPSFGVNITSGNTIISGIQEKLQPTDTCNEEEHTKEGLESENADDPRRSKWLPHYDDTLGKMVYINQATGLSKYDSPSGEMAAVPCTRDVTNMAVSVISKKGLEYKCYPFQTNLVLPFLPKDRAERGFVSETDRRDETQTPGALSTLFSEWNNPVFIRPPDVAVDVTSGHAEGLAVKIHNVLFPYRFTKDMIHSMKVIHQVDKKFLACLINAAGADTAGNSETEGNLLVLVDQHAAHERVRLEGLVAEAYEEDPDAPGQRRLCSSSVTPPMAISLAEEELHLLRSCQPFLRGLALEMAFPDTDQLQVLLQSVPACFTEKENTELRHGRRTVIKSIAEEYLRELIELLRSTGRVRGTLPLTVHNVLASQACHGAIKFNHSLSKTECCDLVDSLSSCQLPFQCAHGRPSIVPLVDLHHLDSEMQELPKPNLRKLRRMCRAWQLYGND